MTTTTAAIITITIIIKNSHDLRKSLVLTSACSSVVACTHLFFFFLRMTSLLLCATDVVAAAAPQTATMSPPPGSSVIYTPDSCLMDAPQKQNTAHFEKTSDSCRSRPRTTDCEIAANLETVRPPTHTYIYMPSTDKRAALSAVALCTLSSSPC